jgi:hypothetical protein
MTILARGDDREAFDYLMAVASGEKPEATRADMRKLAESTINAIATEKLWGLHMARQFKEPQTLDQLRTFMYRLRNGCGRSWPSQIADKFPATGKIAG